MLEVKNMTKCFNKGTDREVRAVDDVDFDLKAKDFVILIGENGSGKSTFLDLITGVLFPDSGSIFINGVEVTNTLPYKRAKWVTRVYQSRQSGLPGAMLVKDVVRLAIESRGHTYSSSKLLENEIRKQLDEVRPKLSNLMNEQTWNLSGGEHQLVNIAITSILAKDQNTNSHLLLLDEHVSQLDPISYEMVMRATADLAGNGNLATIMATHDFGLASQYGNRQLVMQDGRIVHDFKGNDRLRSPEELIGLLSRGD